MDADSKQPNILLLITDQQRADTIEADHICETPHIEFLKSRGIHFTGAHTSNAICSPARASMMTGLYPSRHGMVDCTHTVEPYRAELKQGLSMWSQALKENGYTGAYYGKWHVERTERLEQFGFAEYVLNGSPEYRAYRRQFGLGGREYVDQFKVKHSGYRDRIFYGVYDEPAEATEPYFLYNQGIEFIRKQAAAGNRWFTVISTLEPHDPYTAPKLYFDRYDAESLPLPASYHDQLEEKPAILRRLKSVWHDLTETEIKKAMACYYANCTLIDDQVGRIVNALQETGQLDNTCIIYISDHGELLGGHGLFLKGVPAYEEVYRIPFVIGGAVVRNPGRTSDQLVNLVDLAPTIMELTGCLKDNTTDGHSLAPILRNDPIAADRNPWDVAYAEFHGQRFFYTQRIVWHHQYKYIFNGFDFDELYDLRSDPHEMNNLVNMPEYRHILEDMAKRMWRMVYRLGDYNMAKSDYGMFCFAPVGPDAEEHPYQIGGPDSQ